MKNKIKNRFGFGVMRLPLYDGKFDKESFCKMVDLFVEKGFNYFDTAHGYMDGQSEIAVRECIVKRYPREDIVIADKLSEWFFEKEEQIVPLFEKQLENCGVTYFDYYLFHYPLQELEGTFHHFEHYYLLYFLHLLFVYHFV